MDIRFAGYPSVFVVDAPGSKKKIQHLLWGDWLRVEGEDGDWLQVHGRGCDGWVRRNEVQENRLLEVNFGDGSFIVTPDDKFLLIDAGEGDNMFRFLRWRFGLKDKPEEKIEFDAAIMSHPDSDHYKGFEPLFDSKQFAFKSLYHNGILERKGKDLPSLGDLDPTKKYLLSLFPDRDTLAAHVNNEDLVGDGLLARVMRKALDCAADIRMLSVEDGWVPGYGQEAPVSMQVLAPVPEKVGDAHAYRVFKDKGPTKNGHSVVIKLRYGKVTMILGGDLNIPAEKYLLEHYGATGSVEKARAVFRADVAKACHHGSADLSLDYLKGVDAIVTIVSSGDDEPHCHPRPDALGAFGRHGRGDRPLIFSTELARSAPERIKDPKLLRQKIAKLVSRLGTEEDEEKRKKIVADIDKAVDLDRSVAVYGMINVRTDGAKVIIAQKLETPRSLTGEKWDIHKLEPGANGLEYRSKH
jgi:beta-lactamase superfamily II metal-dependent hydrolase